jgi:hypothetical protein
VSLIFSSLYICLSASVVERFIPASILQICVHRANQLIERVSSYATAHYLMCKTDDAVISPASSDPLDLSNDELMSHNMFAAMAGQLLLFFYLCINAQ